MIGELGWFDTYLLSEWCWKAQAFQNRYVYSYNFVCVRCQIHQKFSKIYLCSILNCMCTGTGAYIFTQGWMRPYGHRLCAPCLVSSTRRKYCSNILCENCSVFFSAAHTLLKFAWELKVRRMLFVLMLPCVCSVKCKVGHGPELILLKIIPVTRAAGVRNPP